MTKWHGCLPNGWTAGPIRYNFSVVLGKMLNASKGSDPAAIRAPYLAAGSIQAETLVLDPAKSMLLTPGELEHYALQRNDIVVVEGGAGYGRSHLLREDMPGWGFQNHVARLRPHGRVAAPFLLYCLKACLASGYVEANNRTATLPSLSREVLGSIPVPIPSLEQQRAIADFLDHETAQIDDLIVKQERLIGVLRERRSAIRDAYFATPNGKRKTIVKRVLKPLDRPPVPGREVITAYRDGEVTLRSNRREDGYTISFTESGYQEVRPGDLVFHALDGFAGAVGVSDSHGNASPVYHVCSVVTHDDPRYVAMLLRYLGTSGFLTTQAPNVRERSVDFRNWSTFARVPLALADPQDQPKIVEHINKQTVGIDTLIAKTQRFIELAKERRAALITAAVTGQIDVRVTA